GYPIRSTPAIRARCSNQGLPITLSCCSSFFFEEDTHAKRGARRDLPARTQACIYRAQTAIDKNRFGFAEPPNQALQRPQRQSLRKMAAPFLDGAFDRRMIGVFPILGKPLRRRCVVSCCFGRSREETIASFSGDPPDKRQ